MGPKADTDNGEEEKNYLPQSKLEYIMCFIPWPVTNGILYVL